MILSLPARARLVLAQYIVTPLSLLPGDNTFGTVRFVEFLKNGFDISAAIRRFLIALDGVVAQLVERLNGIQEVASSILVGSTILSLCEISILVRFCWYLSINPQVASMVMGPSFIRMDHGEIL